jgi:hypothetical protein
LRAKIKPLRGYRDRNEAFVAVNVINADKEYGNV